MHGLMPLLLWIAFPFLAIAQGPWPSPGVEAQAMGRSGAALSANPWSLYANPALLPSVPAGGAVSVSPSPFGVRELSSCAAVFNHAALSGVFGVGLRAGGYSLFGEYAFACGYGYRLQPDIALGLVLRYTRIAIDGYGSAGLLSADAGIAVRASETVLLGACAWNLNQPRIGAGIRERLPMAFALGTSYEPTPGTRMCAAIVKEDTRPFDVRFGVEYRPIGLVALRAGATSEPGSFSAGFGLLHAGIALNYAVSTHPDLGLQHGISIGLFLRPADGPQSETN
jgi:hypothetical protein